MKKWIVALVVIPSFITAALAAEKPALSGAEPGVWTMDIEAARKVAAEKKLPVLLNFTGSDWCGWCKLMDKSVFSQESWKTYARENVMLVWIDFPKDKSLVPEKYAARNKALSEQFDVEGFPSYIVLDDDGKSPLGQLGADKDSTPERFISQLKKILMSRASVVDDLLKALPPAAAQEYRASAKKLADARAELKALKASFEKKNSELDIQIETAQKRVDELRVDAQLTKLPKEKAEAYRAKRKRHAAVTAELQAWVATQPERNEENSKKYGAWRDDLASLEKEMQNLLGQ